MAYFLVLTKVNYWMRCCPGKSCGLLLAIALKICIASNALAGSPLVTDDPGILDPGMWEVIVAVAGEDGSEESVFHMPMLDVSLGLSRNTQLSFLLPYTVVKPAGGDRQSGLRHAGLGYKWRFVSASKWEWAIASNYTLPVKNKFKAEDGSVDARVLSLPLLGSYISGDWTWNGQIGWNLSNHGDRYWDFGLSLGHPFGDAVQLMVEVYGGASSSFDDNFLNYQLGLDYEIYPTLHFLVSAGSRIKSETNLSNRLNYSFYTGLQWFH